MRKFREMIFSGGNKGFTLIELLVVIAVLGILAGIAIPRLGGVRDKAELTEAVAFAGSFRTAQEMHFAEYGNYVTSGTITAGSELPDDVLGEYIDSTVPATWNYTLADETTSGQGYILTISQTGVGNVTATAIGVESSND